MSKTPFSTRVRGLLQLHAPDQTAAVAAETSQHVLGKLDEVFAELLAIHDARDRHDLHWAFEHAQAQFLELSTLAEHWCPHHPDADHDPELDTVAEDLAELDASRGRRVAKLRRTAWVFGALSAFVSTVDIVVSVVLILLITQISHASDSLIASALLGLLVITVVAGVKVSLDRFWLIPRIKRWGWGLYARAVDNFEGLLATMVAASIVDRHLIREGVAKEERVNRLRTPFTMPWRRAIMEAP